MARIAGIDLPKNKRGVIGLTYIYGIGSSVAKNILDKAGIDHSVKVQDWNDKQLSDIRQIIGDEVKVEGELRSFNAMNIKRLKDVGAYKGLRHRRGLPANGQRTKTNARTRKGKKRTIGLGKKAI